MKVRKRWIKGRKRLIPLVRALAALSQGWRCFYCDCRLSAETVTLDELLPQSQGGKRTLANTVAACEDCNKSRGTTDWREFKRRRNSHVLMGVA